MDKKIKTALVSVYYKDNLEPIIKLLRDNGVEIISTGGTQKFIEGEGAAVTAVESLTDYPSIFGGRVKTLHPKVFGGILMRRENDGDLLQAEEFAIPEIDLVIVDLYPFEETLKSGAGEEDVIEKIDIGGISLIRAAAKNFKDVLIVSSREQYEELAQILTEKSCATSLEDRKRFAAAAFDMSSHYDTAIHAYFMSVLPDGTKSASGFKASLRGGKTLRYGENPHQAGVFFGNLDEMFEQLAGKELSYNNLVDIDAAVDLIREFDETAFAILKHTNACGMALGATCLEAYQKALQADPVSAFGGVLITNTEVDLPAAEELNKLFFEALIAPSFTPDALALLTGKKNRMLLKQKQAALPTKQIKTLLNGFIEQDKDLKSETLADLQVATKRAPSDEEAKSLIFASKLVKHTKSNAIVFAKHGQLFASGTGQTSRVDALRQAVAKAKSFGFDLKGAVMASDAFFPFPDCVELAFNEGVMAVIQPGGSIKDKDSTAFCDENGMAMVFTGIRHFKH